ncbi:hypothetical protein [Vibrio sp. TBV020]|uniref:hypothetical protein n=1 Tax=Vibrio sp. TBV020 TaxID=3137398 RepID=UPI0038CD4E82
MKKRRVQPVSGQFVLSAPDGRWEENEKGELAFKHTHTVYFESSVGVGKAKYWADDIEKAQVFTNMDEAVAMLLEVNRAHSPVSIQSLQEVPDIKVIPHPKLKRDYTGRTIRTVRTLKNGWGEIPSGSIGVIRHQSPKGSSIEFDLCSCCTVKPTISGVTMDDIEFLQ